MATADDVRAIALDLPRAYEAFVRNRAKFRVGRIVFASLSPDEEILGFGYPREERDALVASDPDKFQYPAPSDMRYQWVSGRLAAIDVDELRELIVDAWAMCVPKSVSAAYIEQHPILGAGAYDPDRAGSDDRSGPSGAGGDGGRAG